MDAEDLLANLTVIKDKLDLESLHARIVESKEASDNAAERVEVAARVRLIDCWFVRFSD